MKNKLLLFGAMFFSFLSFGCQKKVEKKIQRVSTVVSTSVPEKSSSKPTIEIKKVNTKRVWNDVHTHLSPYTIETFIEVMESNGLQRVVNMSGGATHKRQLASLEASAPYPGRIAHFANVKWSEIDDPKFGKKAAKNLRSAIEMGFAGLKISKALGLGVKLKNGELLKIDDPRLDPLWEEAGKLGVVVAIHTSDPKAFFDPITEKNERYDELSIAPSWSFFGDEFPSRKELLDARNRVIKKHPKTTFMLLHFANNPEDIDEVERLLEAHPNVIVDVAARLAEIGRHDPKKVKRLFKKFKNRILFATDLQVGVQEYRNNIYLRITLGSVSKKPPGLEDIQLFYAQHAKFFEEKNTLLEHPIPIQGRWKIQSIDLSPETLRKIYTENSEKFIFGPWIKRKSLKEKQLKIH